MSIFTKNRLMPYLKSVTGVQEPQGMQGPQGMQEPQGLQEMQGLQGMQEPQGMQGQQEMQGLQGLQEMQAMQAMQERRQQTEYHKDTGVFTMNAGSGDFRILQLTDIHLGGSLISYRKDKKALMACEKLIRYAKPDLVVVTGDLTYPMRGMRYSYDNKRLARTFAALMRHLGVPWAFTFGNHDTEMHAKLSGKEMSRLLAAIARKDSCLLYPQTQPPISGRNNQLIEIRNGDGSLRQGLILLDSHAYTDEKTRKYDFIHEDQVAWYRDIIRKMADEQGRTVPTLAFLHIPLQQYREAFDLYKAGSDEVTYYFGFNEEKGYGKVCCSEFPSTLFDAAVELGSTTGFFCGHDHYNNMSLGYRGIRLTYGMSIDYIVMHRIAHKKRQRGGTLILCHPNGTTDISQLPLTSVEEALESAR